MTKRVNYLIWTAVIGFFAFACQNDEETLSNPQSDDDCLTVSSARNGSVIEGQYIVSLNTDGSSGGRKGAGARVFDRHKIARTAIIKNFEGEFSTYVLHLSKDEAGELKKDDDVAMVEPDRVVSICSCFSVIEPRLVTWNVDHVGYDNGIGKTAWIIDTGIDLDHPDLHVDTVMSHSFIRGVSSPDDDNGHGTHVAGVIGALNNRIGTLGVASGATLIALKVLDKDGEGELSSILNALSYVRLHGTAGDVINLSLGVDDISDILDREIQGVADKGIFIAIAAGNDKKPARDYSPGRASGKNVFTVSAVDSLNRFANFSNYGNDVVDFAAPGVRILSSYKGGKYAIMSGTSMAAPHVAGLLLITDGKIHTVGFATADPDGDPDPLAHQ